MKRIRNIRKEFKVVARLERNGDKGKYFLSLDFEEHLMHLIGLLKCGLSKSCDLSGSIFENFGELECLGVSDELSDKQAEFLRGFITLDFDDDDFEAEE